MLVSGTASALAILGASSKVVRPLACRQTSYGKFADAIWDHLPSIGVRHAFINVPEPDQIETVTSRLRDHSLTPLVMRGGADLSDATCIDALTPQIDTCAKMGVRYMFLSPKHANAPKEKAIEHLKRVGDIAMASNVIVSLETHPDLGTNGDVHAETMAAIDHPNVRVNFDTGNITYYNCGRNAVDELKKCIQYVATVEVKDHNGELESWTFPPLGKGIVDFNGVLSVLDEHSYAGPVTLEFEGVKGVELDEQGAKQAIADSVAYLRSIGTFD